MAVTQCPLGGGELLRPYNPKGYFATHKAELEEIIQVVRRAFGKDLGFDDIYKHLTTPGELFLYREDGKMLGMGSYTRKMLSGIPSQIVEGVALDPVIQGKDFFGQIMEKAYNGAPVIALRTQNPRMYRALEKYCTYVYPNKEETPEAIRAIRKDLADYLGCKIDKKGIVRGYYGGPFYGIEPTHEHVTPFFRSIGLDMNAGDGLLVVGIKGPLSGPAGVTYQPLGEGEYIPTGMELI